jgi:enamine deaminase RidA (YjgF/YER057c/UK114 family)
VATKDLVYTSGTVPSVNGTIPEGIEAQVVSYDRDLAQQELC